MLHDDDEELHPVHAYLNEEHSFDLKPFLLTLALKLTFTFAFGADGVTLQVPDKVPPVPPLVLKL